MCGENFTITCFFLLLQPRGNKISGNRRTGELEDHIGHSFGFAWLLNRTKVGIKTVSTAILKATPHNPPSASPGKFVP